MLARRFGTGEHAAALTARVRDELGVEVWTGPVLRSVPGMDEG